jgi:hypothetical protein
VVFILLILSLLAFLLFTNKSHREVRHPSLKLVFIWFALPYFLTFFISFWMPMFMDKYIIYTSIAFYLLIAIALDRFVKQNRAAYLITALCVLMMVFTLELKTHKEREIKSMIDEIALHKDSNTAIVICPEWKFLGFVYYYNPSFFKQYKETRSLLESESIFAANVITDSFENKLKDYEQLIYVDEWSSLVDPNNRNIQAFKKEFSKMDIDDSHHGFNVYYFSR